MIIKNSKTLLIVVYSLLIVYGLTFALTTVQAASWLESIIGSDSIIPGTKDTGCRGAGDCKLTDFIRVAINLFRLMLGVLGTLALLFFIYGGILMLVSRGNTETIQKGKNTLTQAFIGIMIVLGSWLIVNIVIAALTGEKDFTKVLLFGHSWWEIK